LYNTSLLCWRRSRTGSRRTCYETVWLRMALSFRNKFIPSSAVVLAIS